MERRQHRRFSISTLVRCITDEEPEGCPCATVNISMGGMLLTGFRSRPLPPVGGLIEGVFRDEGFVPPGGVLFDCEVVRHVEDGMAVRFINMTSAAREFLQQIIGQASTDAPSSTEYGHVRGSARALKGDDDRWERVSTARMPDEALAALVDPTRSSQMPTLEVPFRAIRESAGPDLTEPSPDEPRDVDPEQNSRASRDTEETLQTTAEAFAVEPGDDSSDDEPKS